MQPIAGHKGLMTIIVMMRNYLLYIFLFLYLPVAGQTSITIDPDSPRNTDTQPYNFNTLGDAFQYINNWGGGDMGDITIEIVKSVIESSTAVIYESGHDGWSFYTKISIYPSAPGVIISGSLASPRIELNGAANVTFNGSAGGTGTSKNLTLFNDLADNSASTIKFVNDANGDSIKNCIIKGLSTSTTGGVIIFSDTYMTLGNDNNTIYNNDLTGDSGNRPVNMIYSLGASGIDNDGNIIKDNHFYDFLIQSLPAAGSSCGILLSSNTSAWTISGNSFYDSGLTPSGSYSVTYYAIQVNNTSGNNFTITGNYIGGDTYSCGGGAWNKSAALTNTFTGIDLKVGTSSGSNIQGNIIRNFNWANSVGGNWYGISIEAGAVNIGTSTGNSIGDTTGVSSISVTAGGTATGYVYSIYISGTGTVDCQKNLIGSITSLHSGPAYANNIYGIYKTNVSGTTTISNNYIGSKATANSINASNAATGSPQIVVGIWNQGNGTITINNNRISNLKNANTSSSQGYVHGINSSYGNCTFDGNNISYLSIPSANTTSAATCSAGGMIISGTNGTRTVSNNIINNISNTYTSGAIAVVGLLFSGNTTGPNIVSGNFIHTLKNGSTNGSVFGIRLSTPFTCSNNIISVGENVGYTVYGIAEAGTTVTNNSNFYFNTVYVGGTASGSTKLSYALYCSGTTNTKNIRNNILFNNRSTSNGNYNYGIYFTGTSNITCDFNDYYTPNTTTGGRPGYYNSTPKTTLPIVTGQDVSSSLVNPTLSSAGGTSAPDYLPSAASLVAVTGTGITTDYNSAARSGTYPSMGAFEYSVTPVAWTWTGTTSTDWNTSTNWNYGTVPTSSENTIITNVTYKPIVNQLLTSPAECLDLTINSGAVLTIAAGKALHVYGALTNNAGNAGLVVKSDVTGDGILINNTTSVPGTVELYLTGGLGSPSYRFHYIIPPVTTMSIGPTPTIAETKAALGITNFNGDLMSYREDSAGGNKNAGWQYFDGYNNTKKFTSIDTSQGYNVYFSAADKITFTGNLNASSKTFSSLSYTNLGWNLIGNPYPCNIDLNSVTELTNTDNIDNTVYFNKEGASAFWNVELNTGTTGYSTVIAPMQGFFVHVTAASQSLTIPTAAKTLTGANPLRSKGYSIVRKVKLVLDNSTTTDETIVCLYDKATKGFDSNYDAFKLFNSTSSEVAIYSEVNSVKYALNTIPDPGTSSTIIPLTVELKSSGTFTIKATEFDNLDDQSVMLRHGSDMITLSKNATYTFSLASGTYTDFQLIFGNIATQVEKANIEDSKIWYSRDFLNIQFNNDEATKGTGKLLIYNLQGKTVFTQSPVYVTPGQTYQIPLTLQKGVYVLNLTGLNKPIVKKIVVY